MGTFMYLEKILASAHGALSLRVAGLRGACNDSICCVMELMVVKHGLGAINQDRLSEEG